MLLLGFQPCRQNSLFRKCFSEFISLFQKCFIRAATTCPSDSVWGISFPPCNCMTDRDSVKSSKSFLPFFSIFSKCWCCELLNHRTDSDCGSQGAVRTLQVLQRFHGEAGMVYLCNEIKEYSCRPMDRMVVYGTSDGGSNPPGSTKTDA